MTSLFKKILILVISVFVLTLATSNLEVNAQGTGRTYDPLVDLKSSNIPGADGLGKADFNEFIAGAFKFGVSIAIILAVIMVIWGGVEYMTSESPFMKGEGKTRIGAAIGGLVLALSTIVIFNTIDPKIALKDFTIKNLVSEIGVGIGEFDEGVVNVEEAKRIITQYGIDTSNSQTDEGGTVQADGAGLDSLYQGVSGYSGSGGLMSKIDNAMAVAVANKKRIADTGLEGKGCAATMSIIAKAAGAGNKYDASTKSLSQTLLETGKFVEITNERQARVQASALGNGFFIITEASGSVSGHSGWVRPGGSGAIIAFRSGSGLPEEGPYTFKSTPDSNDWMKKIGTRPGKTRFIMPTGR